MKMVTRLWAAAERLEELAKRSSPLVSDLIRREVVAVREAADRLDGELCSRCYSGRVAGTFDDKCPFCDGTGEL
jgi:hypothetical protein